MKRSLLAFLLLVAPATDRVEAEAVARLDIVDRALEFHRADIQAKSTILLEMCSKSGCSELVQRLDGGLFDLSAEGPVRDGSRHVRITNDSVEWAENGAAQAVEADREQVLRDWVMARVYFTFLPFRLNDPSVWKEDLGIESWEGRRLHKVKVTFTPDSSTHAQDEYLYWFDPSTGRLEQFAYSYATDGGGLRFRKAFNHRRIGGVLFFDQQNYGTEGPDLSVDLVDERFVRERMRHVSTIELRGVQVSAR